MSTLLPIEDSSKKMLQHDKTVLNGCEKYGGQMAQTQEVHTFAYGQHQEAFRLGGPKIAQK